MDHPALVRRLDAGGDLNGHVDRFIERQRAAPQPCGERLALDELERQVGGAVDRLQAVDSCDVRVGERREQPRLALEAREPLGVLRELRRQRLDGHVTPQPRVTGAIDLAHAARAERNTDLVGA